MSNTDTTETQVVTAGRNTIKKAPRHRNWFYTWNNYTEDDITQLAQFIGKGRHKFQREICPTTGTPHLQGNFNLTNAITFEALKKKFPKVHWEITENQFAADIYCSKEKTREVQIPSWEKIELYDWQKRIIEIIEQPVHERHIYWFWEEKGGAGKTTFCKYLYTKHKACFLAGNARDGACALTNYEEEHKKLPSIIVMNFAKSQEHIDYKLIEHVKDGFIFSGKYSSRTLCWERPHLFIFGNRPPDEDQMATDKWQIHEIISK